MEEEVVERFKPTSGLLGGIVGMVVTGVAAVAVLLDGWGRFEVAVLSGLLLAALLFWAAMLRPRVWVTSHRLVLRNMLTTTEVPLAAIDRVQVRQVLAVFAGDERFVSPAIGRPLRTVLRGNRRAGRDTADRASPGYVDFVEQRIEQLAGEARAGAGSASTGDGTVVRRRWAVTESVALVVLTVTFVAGLLLA